MPIPHKGKISDDPAYKCPEIVRFSRRNSVPDRKIRVVFNFLRVLAVFEDILRYPKAKTAVFLFGFFYRILISLKIQLNDLTIINKLSPLISL